MIGVDDEIEQATALILAAEDWSAEYDKTPEIHTKLIKSEARLERIIRRYFKDLSEKAGEFINWGEYHQAINAFNVDVIVNNDKVQEAAGAFIKLTLEQVTVATALGAQSGEKIYNRPLGITTSDAVIQDTALNHVATLVGMTVNKDGEVVQNAKAGMNILETTRQDIRQSVSTSIGLGETISEATDRLGGVINNPRRAEVIARTETVNSFGQGLKEFGKQSGAVGKEWQDVGATDECADNTDAGPVQLDDLFPSGDDTPAAHPNCRCSMRLIYQNEVDDNPDIFDSPEPDTTGGLSDIGESLAYTVYDKTLGNYSFDLTEAEHKFIDDSDLSVAIDSRGGVLGRGVLGAYRAKTHQIFVKAPPVESKIAQYNYTFQHELGHAIDYKAADAKLSTGEASSAVAQDRKAVVLNRILRDSNVSKADAEQFAGGRTVITYTDSNGQLRSKSMSKKYINYMRSSTEVFADGYGQYKTDPNGFAKYAPALTKIYEELGL